MSFFPDIDDMLNNAKALDDVEAWIFVMDREAQDEVIKLNQYDQLYQEGIDAMSNTLGQYTEYTKIIKRSKGQRIDHITLFDTGAFYNSFRVFVKNDGLEIFADDVAFYDRPLTEVYGVDILGLTEDNQSYFGDFLLPKYLEFIHVKLLQ